MRFERLELNGDAGRLRIERERGSRKIWIDSSLHRPKRGKEADGWVLWELPNNATDKRILKLAKELQSRTDGKAGSADRIDEFFREMKRFIY